METAWVIHRAWFGPDPLPPRYVEFGKAWAGLNPEWQSRLWTVDEVEPLLTAECRRIWNHIKTHGAVSAIAHRPEVAQATQLADIAGYTIITRLGGVYLNCDMEPLRPLSDLPVRPDEAWACREQGPWINNGALGGPPDHPFWQAVLEQLPNRWDRMPGAPMHQVTGPHHLTDMAGRVPGLSVLPQHYFNFTLIRQVPLGGDASKYRTKAYRAGAVALHHWHHRTAAARTDV